jgi:glutathione synthase/RimK-type ligase-like ATP-grasp enzyme
MILILGSEDDPHVQRVCESLSAHGSPYAILCVSDFPVHDISHLQYVKGRNSGSYRTRKSEIRLSDISTVWFRRLFPPALDPRVNDRAAIRFAMGEARAFLYGMWGVLSDLPWMNSHYRMQACESKPYQLAVAQRAGLAIPRTIVSNDIAAVESFFADVHGQVAYKPLTSYATDAYVADGKVVPSRCVYTNIIGAETLEQLKDQVVLTPCLFQEYVPKEVELRITVVGDRFYTAAIHSQQSTQSKVDWRKYDLENTPYTPYELPDDAKVKIGALMREMGLVYGAIDCILRPDGEIVFLEINPGGQWLWIEELTGMKIGEGIADELMRMAGQGRRASFTASQSLAEA